MIITVTIIVIIIMKIMKNKEEMKKINKIMNKIKIMNKEEEIGQDKIDNK